MEEGDVLGRMPRHASSLSGDGRSLNLSSGVKFLDTRPGGAADTVWSSATLWACKVCLSPENVPRREKSSSISAALVARTLWPATKAAVVIMMQMARKEAKPGMRFHGFDSTVVGVVVREAVTASASCSLFGRRWYLDMLVVGGMVEASDGLESMDFKKASEVAGALRAVGIVHLDP